MSKPYVYPKNLIPKFFMMKRYLYVRTILKTSKTLDIGCNKYKIIPNSIGLDVDPKVKPDIIANVLNLPFTNCYFDSVLALELIEHFNNSDQNKMLSEIYRVLKNKGQLIVSTPNISRYTKKIHDGLWFVSHFIYARKELGLHIGELTHRRLRKKLTKNNFIIKSEKAFSFFNYVVECVKK